MTKSLFHLHLLFTKTYGSSRTSFVQLIKTLIKKVFPHPSATQHAYASLYRLHNKIAYSIRWLTLAPERATDNTRHLLHLSKTNPLHPTLLKAFSLAFPTPASHIPTTFILAAGQGVRWQGEGLKQLAIVNGQPIISRTLKQVPGAIVITHHKKLHTLPYAVPARHAFVLETLLSTQNHWGARTIILLGDVIFDPKDLQTILSCPNDFTVFGSRSQTEIFALSFSAKAHPQIRTHLYRALADAYHGGRGKLWEFYHSYIGLPFHKIGFGLHFINLLRTTDIDTIEDYDRVVKGKIFKSY
ncbi:hypothetical protein A3B57_00435 [Microgenomates group bacterium RIFCSPLOWO2_01_FULL_47_10]|nr:MAG: hypothetical protein A3B57_00435 [Microgenomates group bacterium RIFCSPLOWO2_01_FULL_47_10]